MGKMVTSSRSVLTMTPFYSCFDLVVLLALSTSCTQVSILREPTQIYCILSMGYPWCSSKLQAWNSFVLSVCLIVFRRALLPGPNALRFFHQEVIYNKNGEPFTPALENTKGDAPHRCNVDTWVAVMPKSFWEVSRGELKSHTESIFSRGRMAGRFSHLTQLVQSATKILLHQRSSILKWKQGFQFEGLLCVQQCAKLLQVLGQFN